MISIREVAKLAGVSASTVSRVMNGTAKVDDEKKKRVEMVIKETGFKPNEVARSLYRKSAHIIGVIVPNIENPFFNEMASAIEEEAYKKGYRLTLCSSNNDIDKERNNINLLSRMNADGIILLTNGEGIHEEMRTSTIPMVVLDRKIKNSNEVACIRADHRKGGKMAMEHLIACGCKQIVNMRGPQNVSSARERFEGYLDACKEHQIIPAYIDCQYNYEDGLRQTELLLEQYKQVDGIAAANDMVAISVYKVLTKRGIRVPEQVQIIGFDNISLCALMSPEITTIGQPIAQMGSESVKMLVDHIEGRKVTPNNVFEVALVERQTTIHK